MTKEEIRNEMIRRLAGRLETFFAENADVTIDNAWGEEVTFIIDSDAITAASERILRSAKERLVLVFLNDHCLNPAFLDRFVETASQKRTSTQESFAARGSCENQVRCRPTPLIWGGGVYTGS